MWHNLGKVNVTKGSDVVTGVGTKWVESVRVGDAFQGPDGKLYQIINVASDEALAISPAYEGNTATNLNYWIVPIPGYSKTQADRLSLIISKLDGDIVTANDAAEAAQSAALQAQQWRNEAASSAAAALQSEQNAASAADIAEQARDDAVAVVTGGTASLAPEAGKIPIAGGDGKINGEWVNFDTPSLKKIIDDRITARSIGSSEAVGVALIETGGNGGTFVHINEFNQVIDVTPEQFNKHEIWGAIEDVIIDGQRMVRIPKFYIKTAWTYLPGVEGLKRIWLISARRGAGFRVHPAFMKNGAEIDQIYIGKYQASLEDGKLASVPGVLPAVSRSLTHFTNDALARNVAGVDGFMLWSIYQLSAIQMLFMIEHKTMNSQAAVGQGRVSASSAAEVDAEDVAQASYRGIVGLWGNVWQWCQGLRVVNGAISVWDTDGNQTFVDTPHKRAEDVAEIIYPIDFFDESGDSYDLGDLFVGKTGPTSNSGATAPDYNRLRLGGTFFCLVGGDWSNGSIAGLWALLVSATASDAIVYIGARLAKV